MRDEKGSVIIWILIATMLFAALGTAMMRGTRTSSNMIGTAEATTLAKQIIAQSDEIKSTTKRLLFRNCKDTDLNYFAPGHPVDYTNPTSPPGNRCSIFHINGGGLTYSPISLKAIVPAGHADVNGNGNLLFMAGFQIEGNGTNATDLVIQINYIEPQVCLAINDILGVSNPAGEMPVDTNDSGNVAFVGTFGPTRGNTIGDDVGSNLAGKAAYCRETAAANGWGQYVLVMVAR